MSARGARQLVVLLGVAFLATFAGWVTVQETPVQAASAGNHQVGEAGNHAGGNQSIVTGFQPMKQGQTEFIKTDDSNQVRWEVLSYQTDEGDCLAVVGTSLSTADSGKMESCGRDSGTMRWSGGGIDLDGQWFNVAFGELPDGASEVEITSEDGTRRDAAVSGDVWILAAPDDSPLGLFGAPKRINAKGSAGQTVATVSLALASARRAAIADAHGPVDPLRH